jgi:ABC-type dipeptide/oligopeptide/nickel transport system permease component
VRCVGLDLSALLANSAGIEWVFVRHGIGQFAMNEALVADLPVLMAFTVIVSCTVILTSLCVDILSGVLNPRLRPAGT